MHQPETAGVAECPFEVVHQRPGQIPFNVDPRVDGPAQLGNMALQKADSPLIRHPAVNNLVIVAGAIFGNIDRRRTAQLF
ncbi:hypothetical protein D3C80_1978780 [compost metagenome]